MNRFLMIFVCMVFWATTAFATHVAIDVKDGFAPKWGFSVFDVLSGTLGGFLPMAERKRHALS